MGANSKIEWTDHTFNPWRGCAKVSPGCANCYAEKGSKRNPKVLGTWGTQGVRVIASEDAWKDPHRWQSRARRFQLGRQRVFCGSYCDIFEDRPELAASRRRLWEIIETTPVLRWLLLTKRPENVAAMAGQAIPSGHEWPWNAWLGVSVEDQERANLRIPELLDLKKRFSIPGVFLSCEPLLGPVNMTRVVYERLYGTGLLNALSGEKRDHYDNPLPPHGPGIDWVIAGGESGPKARPMHPDWARNLRDQCAAAGVPFFMKQLGGYPNKRDQMEDFPESLRVREFPA